MFNEIVIIGEFFSSPRNKLPISGMCNEKETGEVRRGKQT